MLALFSGPYFPAFGLNRDQKKLRIWTLFTQCTKSGVNPIETQTIPRVELMGAYLLAKLVDNAVEVIRLIIFFVRQICLYYSL